MKKIIIYTVLLSFLFSYLFVILLSHKVNPDILNYSTVEAKRFAALVVNTSVNDVISDTNLDDILEISKNNNLEVEEVNFNTNKVNHLLKSVTEKVSTYLLEIEEGNTSNIDISSSLRGSNFKHLRRGVMCEMPMGSLYGNSLLANTGPVIPVKLTFIGKVYSSVSTDIKSYGINNSYVEVDIKVDIYLRVSLPNLSKDVKASKKMPIMMKIIQGKIPEYYGSGMNDLYQYSLKLDKNTS